MEIRCRVCRILLPALLVLGEGCTLREADPGRMTVLQPRHREMFGGADLQGWRMPTGEWVVVSGLRADGADPGRAILTGGAGILVNGTEGETSDLVGEVEFGDGFFRFEFMLLADADTRVFLQGRYGVRLADSWGDHDITAEHSGSIGETAPPINASLPAGEWQRLEVVFRAPRFDAGGGKTENARFVEVSLNGVVLHRELEVTGPQEGAPYRDEGRLGPLVLQGNGGVLAVRRLVGGHLDLP